MSLSLRLIDRLIFAGIVVLAIGVGLPGPIAGAQTKSGVAGASPAEPAQNTSPNRRAALRFVTDGDYPPFNYVDEDGQLTGFNVDVARAICLELSATCDIQQRPWAEIVATVKRGGADAAVASHATDARVLRDVDVSDRYYSTPARFVGQRGKAYEITPGGLDRKKIAVAKGTAHEAFLRSFFTLSAIQVYENAELARDAVVTGTADLLFDDGISLVFWLNGTASKACCEFKGGPFVEPRYFGDGVGILLSKSDPQLKVQINWALKRIRESGRFDELTLRYFPLRAF